MSMKADKGYRSEIAGAVHELMSDAHDAGVVWEMSARIRALVYRALFEGRIAGRRRAAEANAEVASRV